MRAYFQSHWNPGTQSGLDCATLRRVGPEGDGGKYVCFDDQLLPQAAESRCHVVSVGVGGDPGKPPDFRFEVDLHRRLPNCTIDVFDGTNFGRGPIRNAPSYVNFHPVNFGALTWKQVPLHVHVFKIDCEGCELRAVEPFVRHVCPAQILMEVHGQNSLSHPRVHRLMTALNQTYGIFMKEPNIQHSDGTCVEFALRRRPHANCSRLRDV